MAVKRDKVHFASVDELLGAPVAEDATTEIRIDQIYPFDNHPFKVLDDEKMEDLVASVKENGVLVPVLVRPDDEGTYEMISGHRRLHAAQKAGLATIPAIIRQMTNDEATIAMVDANIQREEILPSERAFSLKMKMDAMRRQGARTDLTSGHNVPKLSTDEIGEEVGLNGRTVKRFIRLTELIPTLLNLVDVRKINFITAVELSYLDKDMQGWIYEYVKENGFLKKEQITALRNTENLENITQTTMIQIMNEALPENRSNGRVNLSERKLDKYFPPHFSSSERESVILNLLEKWKAEQEG
jgi:ParB family chromosome partitioning protein